MKKADNFDVVVVGAGVTGAIAAYNMAQKGLSVLILEAGAQKSFEFKDYQKYVDKFYNSTIRTPNAPFPATKGAPQPLITDQEGIENGLPQFAKTSYFHQLGPSTYQSTYTRSLGGTTLHWLGTCLRMLPSDFAEKTLYNIGKDWPITYYDLMPYYRAAEFEIGVAADVEDQSFLGIEFEKDYVYPMYKIPQTYSDIKLQEWTKDAVFKYDGTSYEYSVVSVPQGRNSTPNPNYDKGKGYVPVGAVGNPDLGQRCEGNAACTPICPVQAKYNAMKTLQKAVNSGAELRCQSVASKLIFDDSGEVSAIMYKAYEVLESGEVTYVEKTVSAKRYLLTAHAVENAKLMLASGCQNKNIGQNLMDHPVGLSWAQAREPIGPYRGPGSTSGIPALRDGPFRRNRSAFRVEIGTWGWSWPQGTPNSTVEHEAMKEGKFGTELRNAVREEEERHVRFGMLIEQQAVESNCISIDDRYRDAIGNHRPIINYGLSEHEKRGLKAAREFCKQLFAAGKYEDRTDYSKKKNKPGYLVFEGEELWWQGAGHYSGTHIMGTTKENSVVDKDQRSHDHKNLFLSGCGNMPSMGTSNPTLTAAALAVWAAENIYNDLK